jgi:MscS family membrane protein
MNFLGLDSRQWIDIGISAIVLVMVPTIGRKIVTKWLTRLIQSIVGRTETKLDDALLPAARAPIYWLVIAATSHWAVFRLAFLPLAVLPFWRQFFFVTYLILAVALIWRSVSAFFGWYSQHITESSDPRLSTQAVPLLRRIILAIIAGIAIIILLGRLNVDVSALVATMGIGTLAIALAAQAALSDTISGILIMIDRPFRIGDRIEIRDLNTWGNVIDIGLRSTRIQTLDNRTVIIPNSVIEKSLVVNHSFPDTHYRIQMEVGVAYGTDIEFARKTLTEAISNVEGVLNNRSVDALFLNFGDSALIFRLRWWIESYIDTRPMFDKVNTAVYNALQSANILIPFPQREVRIIQEPAALSTEPSIEDHS